MMTMGGDMNQKNTGSESSRVHQECFYELECSEEEYTGFWRDYFDLKENYRSIRKRIDHERDPFLWKAAEQEQGIRILWQDPWEMPITFIDEYDTPIQQGYSRGLKSA